MSKTEADNIKKIETSFLKKHGYFTGWRSGTITWTHGYSGNKSSVGIEVSTMNDENYLRIHYTQTDNGTGEKKDFDYKVQLEKTPCHFGGFRYWFKCHLYKSGVYCGKRVGVLYKDGDWFGCRHCYELTYSSRNANRGYSHYPLFRTLELEMKAEKLEEKTRNYTYRGRPTKKRQKLEKIYREMGLNYQKFKHL